MTQSQNSSSASVGSDRESFMARVRLALGRTRTAAPAEKPPAVDQAIARLASTDDNLPDLFAQRAVAVGMCVHRVTADQAPGALAEQLAELNVQQVGIDAVNLSRQALTEVLAKRGMTIVDWQQQADMDGQFDLDAGITDVAAALAETGTLVITAGPARTRGLSLIPMVHAVVVRASDIVPDMLDYWARLDGVVGRDLPSSTVLITGPSKTADIEGILVTGVHGPGHVHVFLIDDA